MRISKTLTRFPVTAALLVASALFVRGQNPPPVYPFPPTNSPLATLSKPLVPLLTPITQLLQQILNTLFGPPPPPPAKPLNMKLLILATDGSEPSLAAMETMLDRLGTPYQVVLLAGSSPQPLPPLSNGTTGFYQGIILTTGNLGICDPTCRSALSTSGWQALDTYTSAYGVRTLSYYTYPDPRYGLSYAGVVSTSSTTTANVSFASAASSIFPYLVQTHPVTVANAYMYLASAVASSGETTTPILTYNGSVVGVTHKNAAGSEYLALTMDNNPYLVHSELFHYGLIRWLTKGVFLGSRQMYLTPQADDLFLPDDLFLSTSASCIPVGAAADPTFDPSVPCPNVRITGSDLNSLASWQSQQQLSSQFSQFKVSLPFNGLAATTAGGAPAGDSLVSAARLQSQTFFWLNHTWDHEDLDCYQPVPNSGMCSPATQAQSAAEISQNIAEGQSLGLAQDLPSMVTPGISGLTNPGFLAAAAQKGIRYVVSDLSRPEGIPAVPNTGIINPAQPSILEIPRYPTAIFYNTDTDLSGVAGSETDEYNYFYGPNGIFRIGGPGGPPFFTTNQTYAQIVDSQSSIILGYMLRYEMYPLMFHQSNLYHYDGTNSLFQDVMNAVFSKLKAVSSLPVVSKRESDLGQLLWNRMGYLNASVQATITPGQSISISGSGAATIPLTGVCSDACASYGGDYQSGVQIQSNTTRTISVN